MSDSTAPISASPGSGTPASGEEDPRVLAAGVLHALYRLIKGCFLHDDTNQALIPLVESVIGAASQFMDRAHAPNASVLFANNSVFVNRQMLRASRDTYQLALELGGLLAPCNITEVTIEPGVTPTEVAEFGRAIAAMHRDKKPNALLTDGGWAHLRVRKVLGFGGGQIVPAVTRVARTYAASIMIVRAFYADLRKGKFELSHALKRVAQKISGALEDEKRLLLSTAATPAADADRAGVAVSSAIIAVLIASQLSDDRVALTNLAMAALLYDSARIRLARSPETSALRSLNEEEEERLPMSGIVAMTALGKLHPPSIARSVILHEALALRSSLTPPYGGTRAPHILSRILVVARAFAELRVARGASAPLSIDDAIDVLNGQAGDNTARSLVKLLVGTLGVFPAGTMVELSTGELAVVVSTPRLPIDFARPPVRIMYDASARLLGEPVDVDLAAQPKGSTPRFIRKPIDASDQQMKQMRAYVMSLSQRRARSSGSHAAVAPDAKQPKRRPTSPRADLSGRSSSPSIPAVSEPPASSRPRRYRTGDPRAEEGAEVPRADVLSSRPPRARRLDSSPLPNLRTPSDEERRFLEDIGASSPPRSLPPASSGASRGAPASQHSTGADDWTALPPLIGKEKEEARHATVPPSSPRSPRRRDETGPIWIPTSSPPISNRPSSPSVAPPSPRARPVASSPPQARSSLAPLSPPRGSASPPISPPYGSSPPISPPYGSSRSPTTRTWDPRNEDAAPVSSRGRQKVQGFGVRVPPAAPTPARETAAHATSTRQVDWDAMLAAKKEEAERGTPGVVRSDADAILAAYLADAPSAPGVDTFGESGVSSERDSRGSGNAGLRWDRSSSSGTSASVPPSSGPRTPRSLPPADTRSEPPARSSNSGRDSSSGGLRWATQRPRPDEGPSAFDEEPPSPPPSAPPRQDQEGGRAKAGNHGWGAPRRGK